MHCFEPIKPSPKMSFSQYIKERKKIIDIIPLENQFNIKRVQTIKYDSLKNIFIRKNSRTLNLGGKNEIRARPGDRIRILTPGGGGFGTPEN